MADLYADEHFPYAVVEILRNLGHHVLTVKEAGKANQKIPDEEVLRFATEQNRAVLTLNRKDFIKLHYTYPNHGGIIVCRDDHNWESFAERIDHIIHTFSQLNGELIRVNRKIDK
jgi:predicted nuclease of predicted toxin-antitoxin system